MSRFISLAAAAATAFLMPLAASAQTVPVASDNAGNYSAAPNAPNAFTNGANQGTGFMPFVLIKTDKSGFFLYNSNANGNGIDGPGINSSNNLAFGEYANGGDTASATRPFNSALSSGQTFSGSFDNGVVANGSYVDFGLGNAGGLLYQFTYAGADSNYFFNGINTGIGKTYGGLAISFTLTDATHYTFTATSLANPSKTFSTTGTLAGVIDRVNVANHNAGVTSAPDLYFNNLTITTKATVKDQGKTARRTLTP